MVSDAGFANVGRLSPDGRWRWDGEAWQPVTPGWALPPWANFSLRSKATWVALAWTLAVGLLADQALRSGAFGLGLTATFGVGALALGIAGPVTRREPRVLIGVAALFAAWFTLRASPWLLWPDLAASLLLMGLAASLASGGTLLDLGIAEAFARAVHSSLHLVSGAGYVWTPLAQTRGRLRTLVPLARGTLIAAPIAVLLILLLASADPVFASFFNLQLDLGQISTDILYVLVGALAAAGLLRMAAAEPVGRVDGPAWRLGAAETFVVFAVLDAVFAAFAFAQALAATGAADATLRAAGVTYAEYARSGFFQLLWVAAISLVVLVVFSRIASITAQANRAAFVVLAEIAIALTLLIVVVAFSRLSLYEDAYGFTMLRLYSHIFAGWIALVFVLLAADLAGIAPRHRWFVGAVTVSALALLFVLNVANPEGIVVTLNVQHAQTAHKVDTQYFAGLSADATPALIDASSRLDPALRQQVRAVACAGPRTYSPGLAAYNWADAQSADARRTTC